MNGKQNWQPRSGILRCLRPGPSSLHWEGAKSSFGIWSRARRSVAGNVQIERRSRWHGRLTVRRSRRAAGGTKSGYGMRRRASERVNSLGGTPHSIPLSFPPTAVGLLPGRGPGNSWEFPERSSFGKCPKRRGLQPSPDTHWESRKSSSAPTTKRLHPPARTAPFACGIFHDEPV